MNKSDNKRVLIVEDEVHIAEGLEVNLSLQGYDTKIADSGPSALKLWREWNPHLIVLDIMLPEIDGLSVLQSIRLEDEHLPILILSAKTTTDDKIKGLSYGVDDYMTKPFELEEFLLRVDRMIKRVALYRDAGGVGRPGSEPEFYIYSFGKNEINFQTSTAVCGGRKIKLTEQEVKLLKLFVSNKGKPLSRKKLLEIGWSYSRVAHSRTVDNFMVRLRKYFEEDPKKPRYFTSLRSVGYVFDHE